MSKPIESNREQDKKKRGGYRESERDRDRDR